MDRKATKELKSFFSSAKDTNTNVFTIHSIIAQLGGSGRSEATITFY